MHRWARACTGGPSVGMKCSTLCLAGNLEKLGAMMSGNSASSRSYLSVEAEMVARRGAHIRALPNGMDR